jgi:succinate dehydrogenase/fumarate reductase-like Fe-S protein
MPWMRRCRLADNCVDVCPKKIDLPGAIDELRKRAL